MELITFTCGIFLSLVLELYSLLSKKIAFRPKYFFYFVMKTIIKVVLAAKFMTEIITTHSIPIRKNTCFEIVTFN